VGTCRFSKRKLPVFWEKAACFLLEKCLFSQGAFLEDNPGGGFFLTRLKVCHVNKTEKTACVFLVEHNFLTAQLYFKNPRKSK